MNISNDTKNKLCYFIGEFGNDIFYYAISAYIINFITNYLVDTGDSNLNNQIISIITLLIMIVRIAELVIDPFIGNVIDRTHTKFGHFRPWILIGGTVSAILSIFLFTNLGGLLQKNPWLYVIIFVMIYALLDLAFAFRNISFWSMLPASSFDGKSREKTAIFARLGSIIGSSVVGIMLFPTVLFFSSSNNDSMGDINGWFCFACIVAIIGIVNSVFVSIFFREKKSYLRESKKETKGFVEVIRILFKNDQLLWTSIAYLFYCIAINIVNSLGLYYFQYILGDAEKFSALQTINMFIGILEIILFPIITTKLKRKVLLYICLTVMLTGLICYSISNSHFLLVIISAELFYMPQPLVFLVVLMIYTDCVEYGQLKLGHRDESVTISWRQICDKFGGSIGDGVVGQIAIFAGMTVGSSAKTITSSSILKFKIGMFVIPVILIILTFVLFVKKVKLNEKIHNDIVYKLRKTWQAK